MNEATLKEAQFGWPKFLKARAMEDGSLAVAILRGNEVLVGQVSLNGLHLYNSPSASNRSAANIITNGKDFISLTLEQFNELDYHKHIPAYKDVPAIEQR